MEYFVLSRPGSKVLFNCKHVLHALCFLFVLSAISVPCMAKIIPRRDPLDGALDATAIVIMARQSPDTFRIEESFLGSVGRGDLLTLPGFRLTVEDASSFISGVERIQPIQAETRILVFLRPAKQDPRHWEVAGFGNCYFWSHDPLKLDSLLAMAVSALDLRRSWEAARSLPDVRQRVEALWGPQSELLCCNPGSAPGAGTGGR